MTPVEYGNGLNDCVQQENGHGTHQKKKKTVMASQLRKRRSRPKMSLEVLFNFDMNMTFILICDLFDIFQLPIDESVLVNSMNFSPSPSQIFQ
jgi:hypothetical protein